MRSVEDIKQLFRQSIDNNSWWRRFKGSEFSEFLVNFISNLSYRVISVCERLLQEGFISKAVTPMAILSHAESRGYVAIKRTPTIHSIELINKKEQIRSIPSGSVLIEQSSGQLYLIESAVVISASNRSTTKCKQVRLITHSTVVDSERNFFNVGLPAELSSSLSSMRVFVTESDGKRREWTRTHLFRNTNEQSYAYVEYFSSDQVYGIKFGNGSRGKKPELNAKIEIECVLTNGYSELPIGAKLKFENANFNQDIDVQVTGTITHGTDREDVDSIRYNAMYFVVYDDDLIYSGDYEFFIHDKIRGLTFLSVWGEAEQEKLHGANSDWINNIFIAAYHPDYNQTQIKEQLKNIFQSVDKLNIKFKPVTCNEQKYTIQIDAKASTVYPLETVEESIKEVLRDNFSSARKVTSKTKNKKAPTVDEIYELISGLKMCEEFKIEIKNLDLTNKPDVGTYRYMDVVNSTINISYKH